MPATVNRAKHDSLPDVVSATLPLVLIERPPSAREARGKDRNVRGEKRMVHQNGQIFGMRYIDNAQNNAIKGTPTLVKSRKR